MDPFNIVIRKDGRQLDLNVHPEKSGSYKIVFQGKLIGELYRSADVNDWHALPLEHMGVDRGLAADIGEKSEDLLLDAGVLQSIASEIARIKNGVQG